VNRELKSKIVLVYGTQADAAVGLGINEPRLSRIVNGRILPKPDEAMVLQDKFGIVLAQAKERKVLAV